GELLRLPLPPQGAGALSFELGHLPGELPRPRGRALRGGALRGHGAPQGQVTLGTLLEPSPQRLEDGGMFLDLGSRALGLPSERLLAPGEVTSLADQLLDAEFRVCASF